MWIQSSIWFLSVSLTLHVATHAATQPQFPKLPNAFSTVVEANILNGNYTAIMSEIYDFNQSKSFRSISSSKYRAGTVNLLDLYNDEQQWMWETNVNDSRPTKCQVSPINMFDFDLHGIHGTPSVNQFFGVKNASSTTYNGTGVARGIPCDIFVERVNFSRVEGMKTAILNYETFYYFSREPWTWFRPESRIPVRVIIRGSHRDVSSNVSLNDFHTFEHYYEFVHFEERADFTKVSSVVSSADTHLCDVTKYCMMAKFRTSTFCSVNRGPPMPKIAETFSTHVSSSFTQRNRTINSFEAFDGEHKVLHVRSAHHDHSHFVLADMEHNEVWIWDTKPGSHMPVECDVTTVRRTTNPTVELFRHTHDAGPYHSMDFFTFGGSMVNETYIGKSLVRGIPVRGWYRRIIQNASAFHPPYEQEEFRMDVFYYFSEEGWSYPPWNMSGIPVRIRVQGDATEIGDPAHKHTFDHVYDYVEFRAGHEQANLDESFNHDSTAVKKPAQEEHEFLPPIDWLRRGLCNTTRYCSGHSNPRKAVCASTPKKMPPFPQAWSTHVEANLMDKNRTINVFEAWDHDHQIYHQRQAAKDHTHRLLADLKTNETWIWDTKKEFGDALPTECHVTVAQRVSNPELRHLFAHSHDGHMYSSSDFFNLGSPSTSKFVGEGVIRGIPVSIFSSHVVRNMTALHAPYEVEKFDFTVFYYMSEPSKWKFGHLNGTNKVSVPVRVHVKGTGSDLDGGSHFHAFEHVYEYSNFRVGEEEAHFDETFNHDKTHEEESHEGHHAHEFLPPIDWVRKQKCNTTTNCASGNPRKEVCQPTQLVTSSGASSSSSKNCDTEETAAIVVGVVLGVALLISWGVLAYMCVQVNKGAPSFGKRNRVTSTEGADPR